jgi:cytochrome c556
MHHRMITAVGLLTLAVGMGACRREATVEPRNQTATRPPAPQVDRASELQRQRDQELAKMDERVASLERKYQEKRATSPNGTVGTTGTTVVRDEVTSDLDDVKKAVDNLRTTTPENWWERHESALKTAFHDVQSDVEHFTGKRTQPEPAKNRRAADASGQPISTAPFTSSRDKFVADMRARVDAMNKALDSVKASGPRKVSMDDLHTRVNKLGDDIDNLKSASAEDWWDLSKARVNDYIDRVEKSLARLDNSKR